MNTQVSQISSEFGKLNSLQASLESPIEAFVSVEEVLSLRAKSQTYQAEGRTGNREGTKDLTAIFDRSKANDQAWPIQVDKIAIALVDDEPRYLGGFKRGIALNASKYEKTDIIPIVFYGNISASDAMTLAGIDNLHLGDKESPLQRAIRARASILTGGDPDIVLHRLCLSEASYKQYCSIIKNLGDKTRRSLACGLLSDAQARAIAWLMKADEETRTEKELIEDSANVIARKAEIEAKRKGPEPKGPEPKGPEPKGPEPKGPEPKGPESKGPESKGPESKGPEPKRFLTVADRVNYLKEVLGNHFNNCPRDARGRFIEDLVDFLADLQD